MSVNMLPRRAATTRGSMFPTLVRRLAQSAKEPVAKQAPLAVPPNPYMARKVWPPNFKELNQQQQLRFEKKYKRRILLASRSPRWDKAIRLAQIISIAAALLWLLFYSEFEWWGEEYKPSQEMRRHAVYLFGILDPEKRFERREDAPEVGTGAGRPESKSEPEPEPKTR